VLLALLHHLWGVKTVAIFDIWSIEHILSGVSVGSAVRRHTKWELKRLFPSLMHSYHSFHFDVSGVLLLGYFWETIEHYLETGLAGVKVEHWFQGVEYWPNRMITDPLLLVLGYVIAKRYPKLVFPARIFSITWLLVHIIVFPDSMYLQRVLSL
jgi:hypothetical protein